MNIQVVQQEVPGKEKAMETISAIVPVTERYDDVNEMYEEYKDALSKTGKDFEMIYVVDGDFPEAYQQLKSLREMGEKLTLVKHSRSFGEAIAITSGFKQAAED